MITKPSPLKRRPSLRPSFSGGDVPKLTSDQAEVLHLLLDERLTIKQIAIRRQTTVRAVQLIVQFLQKRGLTNKTFADLRFFDRTSEGQGSSFINKIRLHGQQFHVSFLFCDLKKYARIKQKANVIYLDGNTVELNKDSIDVSVNRSFVGGDVEGVTKESLDYFQRFLVRLERDLKVSLFKPRSQNVRLTKAHYAEVNNELAKECEVSGDKIKIKSTDDGKLWFIIDNSFNLHEAETVHPETSKRDMGEVVRPFFNDLRDKEPPLPSEVWKMLSQVVQAQYTQALQMQTVLNILVPKKEEKEKESSDETLGWYIG